MDDRNRYPLLLPFMGFLVVVAFGIGVIAMAAFADDDAGTPTAAAADEAIEVTLGDVYIEPEEIQAQAGPISLRVHNEGKTEHNLAIEGLGKTEMVAPGDTVDLVLASVEPGRYTFICEVVGHADAGMKGVLSVGETTADSQTTDHAEEMSPEDMVAHDTDVTGSFPAETKGKGGVSLKPEIAPDGTKVFTLTAEAIEWETEPGKVLDAYAYNGMIPGPTIEANLGDTVRIVLHNELPEPTTMHFHGMTVPANMDGVPVISQDAIMPGERFVYEFTVRNTGSNMYHSHFNAQKQVPMGLLGAFIVPDPADPEVDVDYTMILNDGPLGFTLNGKGFPATEPVVAERGQLVRVRYMNEGLLIHPMHLHGMPQKVIAKDGHLLSNPYEADTVLVGPGERYDVLVRADELGAWAFHCHVLNHAEGPNGMFGMVTAFIVQ